MEGCEENGAMPPAPRIAMNIITSRAPEDEHQWDPEVQLACHHLPVLRVARPLSQPLPCLSQMIDRPDNPAYAMLRLNPVRSDWLYDSASELWFDQSSLRTGYRGCYAFYTAEGVTAPAPPRDRRSYLGR